MSYPHSDLSDRELVNLLRRQSWIWFKNDDILLLDELIRRFEAAERHLLTLATQRGHDPRHD